MNHFLEIKLPGEDTALVARKVSVAVFCSDKSATRVDDNEEDGYRYMRFLCINPEVEAKVVADELRSLGAHEGAIVNGEEL